MKQKTGIITLTISPRTYSAEHQGAVEIYNKFMEWLQETGTTVMEKGDVYLKLLELAGGPNSNRLHLEIAYKMVTENASVAPTDNAEEPGEQVELPVIPPFERTYAPDHLKPGEEGEQVELPPEIRHAQAQKTLDREKKEMEEEEEAMYQRYLKTIGT